MGRGKSRKTLDLIDAAYTILAEIQPASVRAVCYRLFTLNILDSMSKSETNRVSTQLTWAHETGVIPRAWIVDESRDAERISAWEDPAAYVDTVSRSYRRDRWADQPEWIELWSEKGTVRGVLAPVLNDYGITFRVMHGYGSATAIHQIAAESRASHKYLTALYVGDWDPSGLHMSEVDLPRRLREYDGDVELVRLALTDEDCYETELPSFATDTKKRDPRYRWYTDGYGSRCWELDALSPVLLRDRVTDAIERHLDHRAWHRAAVAEKAKRESLTTILSAWPDISGQATKYKEANE